MSNIKEDLECLEKSTMFHMSLGSKELFHSNFLHWLAENYWDFFIEVMHKLAGLESFWWENVNGPNGKIYSQNNNNLKVLRENRNFDLSIYILDSEIVDEEEKKQIWIPVLVLENKVKSLPYKEQLDSYTKKAFEEWKRGSKIGNIDCQKEQAVKDKSYKWTPENGITFILLSLLHSGLDNQDLEKVQTISFKRKKKDEQLHIYFKWISQTYHNLLEAFENSKSAIGFHSDLDRHVFEDYKMFVESLINIASNDWKIDKNDNYIDKICPWSSSKGYEPDKQTLLRIDDIRQKIHYSQMQKMLMDELETEYKDKGKQITLKRVMSPSDVNEEKEGETFTKPIICCSTNYMHNLGILEIYVTYDKNLVGVQIQGNAYEHVFFDIEKKDKETYLKLKDEMENLVFFFEFEKDTDPLLTEKFPRFGSQIMEIMNRKSKRFKKGLGNNRFGYYEKSGVIYQKVYIPEYATITNVISAIVEDIKCCVLKLWKIN